MTYGNTASNDRLAVRAGVTAGCALLAGVACHHAAAADPGTDRWSMRATAQAVAGSYNDSDLRDSLFGAGVFIAGDYLEQGGFAVGYNYTEVEGKGSGAGTFDTLEEDTYYLSGKLYSYPDRLPGRLSWRLDGYWIQDEADGDALVGADADIGVLNPIIGFTRHDKSLALDFGYAYSNYDYDGGDEFQAHQFTPTVGFPLGGPSDWLQLRGFFIHLSDDDANDGNGDTAALEAKWTHWLSADAPLGWHSVGVTAMLGERFLAVDPDAAVAFTLADEQQGSIALNSAFNLGANTRLMLQVGYEQYENRALSNDYDSLYVYINVSHGW